MCYLLFDFRNRFFFIFDAGVDTDVYRLFIGDAGFDIEVYRPIFLGESSFDIEDLRPLLPIS